MARISQEERKRIKREAILKSARFIFERKGFSEATIQDITDECGISRGGIYLYFKSLDEVFIAVLTEDDDQYLQAIQSLVHERHPFEQLLDSFFSFHRERLMGGSMVALNRAMYEFFLTQQKQEYNFQKLELSRKIIIEILEQGVREGVLQEFNLSAYADNMIFTLEGMGILAMLEGLTENAINEQFEIMKDMLPYMQK